MSEAELKQELHINASELSTDQLLTQLTSADQEAKIVITGLSEQPAILAGLNIPNEILIKGHVGPMAFMASEGIAIEVAGNAGLCCGHSLISGSILVRGDAGNFLAAYATGGYLAVHGRAGNHVAFGLSGADILVRSHCGDRAAAGMRSGTLVLGNGCGNELGYGMTGGTIYVRGEIGSVAKGVQQGRLRETDTIRLSLMLVRAGIKTTYEKFQVFRASGDRGRS